ncbi:alpha/beta hydrolase [Duganella sp. PWIR1]
MQPHLRQRLAALGSAITPDFIVGTSKLFAADAPRPDPDSSTVLRDVSYGPHERHKVDVFIPTEGARSGIVLLFVHGGGFTMGSKGAPTDAFYNHIGAWAVKQGWVGVTMNYRLAPESVWPAGSDDVQLAAQWLHERAGNWFDASPSVVLMGQSAGAAHVAGCLARWPHTAQKKPQGAILLSGLYDLSTLQHSERENIYYGTDATQFAARSSLPELLAADWPCLYTVSELDPAPFQQQAARVVSESMVRHRRWPQMIYLDGHNHLSSVQQLGGPNDTLGGTLAEFINRICSRED